MMEFFKKGAQKAQAAALLAFLGPITTYVLIEGDWSWRAMAGAVLSGLAAGITVFYAHYEPLVANRHRKSRYQRQQEDTP